MEIKGNEVILYCRVSLSDAERQHPENQVNCLTDYARRNDWHIKETIIDRCSGAKDEESRPGLKKVMDMAHKRLFDILLVYDSSRLTRENTLTFLKYLDTFRRNNIAYVSYCEPFLNMIDPHYRDLICSLIGFFASFEREKIRTRVKEGLKRVKAEGKTLGRPKVDIEKIKTAQGLRTQGKSYTQIGLEMKISRIYAFQLCNKYKI